MASAKKDRTTSEIIELLSAHPWETSPFKYVDLGVRFYPSGPHYMAYSGLTFRRRLSGQDGFCHQISVYRSTVQAKFMPLVTSLQEERTQRLIQRAGGQFPTPSHFPVEYVDVQGIPRPAPDVVCATPLTLGTFQVTLKPTVSMPISWGISSEPYWFLVGCDLACAACHARFRVGAGGCCDLTRKSDSVANELLRFSQSKVATKFRLPRGFWTREAE